MACSRLARSCTIRQTLLRQRAIRRRIRRRSDAGVQVDAEKGHRCHARRARETRVCFGLLGRSVRESVRFHRLFRGSPRGRRRDFAIRRRRRHENLRSRALQEHARRFRAHRYISRLETIHYDNPIPRRPRRIVRAHTYPAASPFVVADSPSCLILFSRDSTISAMSASY